MRPVIALGALILTVPLSAGATLTFEQLDQRTFTISHRVKWVGGRGQAMELVYEKAASLCVAAEYSHFEIVNQESHAGGGYEAANATVTVRFFHEAGDDRVACDVKASDDYVKEAREKLEKRGYTGPAAAEASGGPQEGENHCTVEQITAMVRAGLTENQIKAACAVGD